MYKSIFNKKMQKGSKGIVINTWIDRIKKKYYLVDDKNPHLKKIKLSNNKPLNKKEFQLVTEICDIFKAIEEAAGTAVCPPEGGVFWSNAKRGTGPFDLHLR